MKIGIFGTGAYGMALASILSENKHDITMWTKFQEEKDLLIKDRGNQKLLPGFFLDNNIKITNNINECAKDKDLLVIAIPAAFVTDLCSELSYVVDKDVNICIASKGIEQNSGLFVHQIVGNYIDSENIAVISGPSFAVDVVTKKPIGLTLAATSINAKNVVNKAFRNDYVKLRHTNDIIGTEICGSIKNVIALASGILEGLNASDSTRAMFITESIHDIEEIINAFDGDRRTVLSFAGFGDLLLTCTSTTSRNYSYGKLVGERKSKEELDNYVKNTTVEGYYTLESIYQLLNDKNVSIPVINLIYSIIKEGANPNELLTFLVTKL